MVKLLKRTTDNKFLKSLAEDLWVEDSKEAFEMNYLECISSKETLSETYTSEQLKEVVIFSKSKPLTREEVKQIRNLLKKIIY
jgi:hypothetical protein